MTKVTRLTDCNNICVKRIEILLKVSTNVLGKTKCLSQLYKYHWLSDMCTWLSLTVMMSCFQDIVFMFGRYQWLFEDMFTRSGRTHIQVVMPSRTTVMSELRKV